MTSKCRPSLRPVKQLRSSERDKVACPPDATSPRSCVGPGPTALVGPVSNPFASLASHRNHPARPFCALDVDIVYDLNLQPSRMLVVKIVLNTIIPGCTALYWKPIWTHSMRRRKLVASNSSINCRTLRSRSLNRSDAGNHSSEITDLEPRRARHTQRPAPSAQQGKKLKGWVRRTMRPPSPQVGPGPGQYVTTHRIFMKLPGGTRPGVRRPRPACARH